LFWNIVWLYLSMHVNFLVSTEVHKKKLRDPWQRTGMQLVMMQYLVSYGKHPTPTRYPSGSNYSGDIFWCHDGTLSGACSSHRTTKHAALSHDTWRYTWVYNTVLPPYIWWWRWRDGGSSMVGIMFMRKEGWLHRTIFSVLACPLASWHCTVSQDLLPPRVTSGRQFISTSTANIEVTTGNRLSFIGWVEWYGYSCQGEILDLVFIGCIRSEMSIVTSIFVLKVCLRDRVSSRVKTHVMTFKG
jgi:hypothetical protein